MRGHQLLSPLGDPRVGSALQTVCQREQEFREERRVRTGLKLSGLPVGKSLESFDFAFQRSVDKSQIDLLATSEFVRRKEVVLLLGPPGVGKSHLAAGLGRYRTATRSPSWAPTTLSTWCPATKPPINGACTDAST